MNKGFIFTLDALFAIALLLSVGAFVMLGAPFAGESQAFEFDSARTMANDEAITYFYLGLARNDEVPANRQQYYCFDLYQYDLFLKDPANPVLEYGLLENKVCKYFGKEFEIPSGSLCNGLGCDFGEDDPCSAGFCPRDCGINVSEIVCGDGACIAGIEDRDCPGNVHYCFADCAPQLVLEDGESKNITDWCIRRGGDGHFGASGSADDFVLCQQSASATTEYNGYRQTITAVSSPNIDCADLHYAVAGATFVCR